MEANQKAQCTPGGWRYEVDSGFDGPAVVSPYGLVCKMPNEIDGENEANAALIGEAGTVLAETGLSPRELADQRNELLASAKATLEWARTPGNHGGNPYCKPLVRAAIRALVSAGVEKREDWGIIADPEEKTAL